MNGKYRRTGLAQARLVMGAALVAVVVAACGGSASTTSPSASNAPSNVSGGKHVSVAFLNLGATTYTIAMNQQAQQTAAGDNASLAVENGNFDPAQQLAQCQDVISQHKYQGLLIYPVNNAAATPCVRQAVAAGLKVADVESQIGPKVCTPGGHQVSGISLEVYFCPADFGNNWAKIMTSACKGLDPCNVAIFTGPPSYALVPQEISAFQTALKEYPNLHVNIVAHFAPGYDSSAAAEADTKSLMLRDPHTNVIIEDDDASAGGVAQALKQLGKTGSVKLVGADADTEAIARIKAGTEYATVIDTPRTDTEYALKGLISVIRGQRLAQTEVDSTQISPLGKGDWILTKANVDKFDGQFS